MKNSTHTEEQPLIKLLRTAFSQTPYIELNKLVSGKGWESASVIEAFEEHGSLAMSDEMIEEYKDSLTEFSAAGLQVVLPQYMEYSVKNVTSGVTSYLLYRFSDGQFFELFLKSMSAKHFALKRYAICKFIEFIKQQHPDAEEFSDDLRSATNLWCKVRKAKTA